MAAFLKSVVGGFLDALKELQTRNQNHPNTMPEAMVRARRSLSVEYALAFKNPGPTLKRFLTVVGGMLDNMVGSNTTKAECYSLLLRVATSKPKSDGRGVGHLDSVLAKKGHPLLFLTAVWKAGLMDELLGDPLDEEEEETYEDREWGFVGDASKDWCGKARTRDLETFRKRVGLTPVQKKTQIDNFVRVFLRKSNQIPHESEEDKARRWFEAITKVYFTLLGTGELENYGAGVDGVMGGGVGVGEGGGGGGVGGGGGIPRTTSAMVAAASRLLDMSALNVTEEYVTLFAQMAIWSNDLLSIRQLFPLSGAHQSAFIDISVWHGITKVRAQKMVGESMIMVEERKDKVYKRWISIVLDSQAYGAKNATPGYLSRMNPNYIRWGVDPQTRDKYAGAAGQLLAWGIKVQKVSFFGGLCGRGFRDWGTGFVWRPAKRVVEGWKGLCLGGGGEEGYLGATTCGVCMREMRLGLVVSGKGGLLTAPTTKPPIVVRRPPPTAPLPCWHFPTAPR
jgi:hypothetical protein